MLPNKQLKASESPLVSNTLKSSATLSQGIQQELSQTWAEMAQTNRYGNRLLTTPAEYIYIYGA